MPTVYISAKIGPGNDAVRALLDWCEQHGYKCAYDWTANKIERPFAGQEAATTAADAMLDATSCDLYVLILSDGLVGALIELGAALKTARITGGDMPVIYIVGTAEQREASICYHSSHVNWYPTIEELKDAIGQK